MNKQEFYQNYVRYGMESELAELVVDSDLRPLRDIESELATSIAESYVANYRHRYPDNPAPSAPPKLRIDIIESPAPRHLRRGIAKIALDLGVVLSFAKSDVTWSDMGLSFHRELERRRTLSRCYKRGDNDTEWEEYSVRMVERELEIIELGKRWKSEIKALIKRLRDRLAEAEFECDFDDDWDDDFAD